MKSKSPIGIVLFTIFLDMLGYGILIPVLPQLFANPQSSAYLLSAETLPHGYVLLGFLIAVFPIAQFFATPILGQLSDRYGRKKILLISLVGTCFSYVLFALGVHLKNIPLLFFARALDGVTGGNIAVAQAAVADITKPENRTKNFGLIGAAFGLGFVVGPFLGGKLSDPRLVSWFDAATPFWFAAILSLTNVLSVAMRFEETHPRPNAELKIRWHQSIVNIMKAFNLPGLRALYSTAFLFHCGFSFFTTFVSVYLITRFGFDQGHIGNFFAYVGGWVIFTQALVTRRVSRLFNERQVLHVSLILCGSGVLSYFLAQSPKQLLLVVPLFAIFNGLSQANLVGLISRSVDASIQGEVLGINASIQAFGQAVPPVISGYLAAGIRPSFPLLVAGLTIIAAGILFNIFFWNRKAAVA